jgi:hypothetical protein
MNHLRFALLLLTIALFSTSCYRKQAIFTESTLYGNKQRVLPAWYKKPTYFRSVFRISLWGGGTGLLLSYLQRNNRTAPTTDLTYPILLGGGVGILTTEFGPPKRNIKVLENERNNWLNAYNKENFKSYTFAGSEGDYILLDSPSSEISTKKRETTIIPSVVETNKKEINTSYKIRHALIIGNSQYRTLMPIPNAVNDVNIVAKALGILGFKTTVLNDFTSSQFDEKWTYFKQDANNTEVLLIYYVGHGMAFEGNNYFLPVETNIKNCNDVRRQGIKVSELIEDISKLNSKINLFYLDSFQQNNIINCTQLNTPTTTTDEVLVRKRGVRLAEKSTIPNLMFYNASQGDGAMPSVGKNGHFTKAFIDNLKIGIDSDELMRKITNSVLIKTNQKQLPETSGSLMDTFIF